MITFEGLSVGELTRRAVLLRQENPRSRWRGEPGAGGRGGGCGSRRSRLHGCLPPTRPRYCAPADTTVNRTVWDVSVSRAAACYHLLLLLRRTVWPCVSLFSLSVLCMASSLIPARFICSFARYGSTNQHHLAVSLLHGTQLVCEMTETENGNLSFRVHCRITLM